MTTEMTDEQAEQAFQPIYHESIQKQWLDNELAHARLSTPEQRGWMVEAHRNSTRKAGFGIWWVSVETQRKAADLIEAMDK